MAHWTPRFYGSFVPSKSNSMACGVGDHTAAAAQQELPIMTEHPGTEGATQRGEGIYGSCFLFLHGISMEAAACPGTQPVTH